jgi:XapX domain-containing protein
MLAGSFQARLHLLQGGRVSPLLISLAAGVFIGLIYALLNVRSPAPPAVALVGLLGMIIGSSLGGKLTPLDSAASLHTTDHTQSAVVRPSINLKQAG